MSSQTLTTFDSLRLVGDPKRMIQDAQNAADALMEVVKRKKDDLEVSISGRKHLKVEAWETLAYFCGISAKIVDTRPVYDEISEAQGFEAQADAIRLADLAVISSARAMCLNNEDNWSMRPKYEWENGQKRQVGEVAVPTFQLQSMAQTRAIGKVLRNVLAFIVVLAGYDATPAEEITGNERHEKANGKDPQPKQDAQTATRISDPQRKRIFAIGHEHQVPMTEISRIIERHGFKRAFEITKDKYDAVCEEVSRWSPQAAA
ncbi:MAG: hypothetical protein ACRD8A_08805 [Candidatus Acidiferrales bacterium]